jgi:hypothetical protein
MNRFIHFIVALVLVGLALPQVQAGNPDRQGEAGAYELLMNPWARSAGLHTMTTASITGVEAMRLNVAGISRVTGTQIAGGHSIYLQGTGIGMSSFGLVAPIGKSSALGVSIQSVSFGEIPVTTTSQPEGTGATFRPNFFNIGLSYGHMFDNKVSVGVLFRGVSETISDLSASTFAIDAGVQYVTGENDQMKFGVSLRNVGAPMRFQGEGLAFGTQIPLGASSYTLTAQTRAAGFELQSMLNIGVSYDFLLGGESRFTLIGNFTSNSFSQDNLGAGVEFALNKNFMLRGAYRYEVGSQLNDGLEAPLYTGPSAGATLSLPFNRNDPNSGRFSMDYAYRVTKLFGGTHNMTVTLDL